MARDVERIRRIQAALGEHGVDALVCALPVNVLLLSGYWPVVGTSLAVVTRDGVSALIVPEDERELAASGAADEVNTFHPASVADLRTAEQAVLEPLAGVAKTLRIEAGRLGYEDGAVTEPDSYAAMHLYGASLGGLLRRACPSAELVAANELLTQLRAVKTQTELNRIRTACSVAALAFAQGARQLRPGLREVEAAALFRTPLSTAADYQDGTRADGFAFCMSGPNSAKAAGAYARSRARPIERGDLVLVHCNSTVDGYWTDITRTYCIGEPSRRHAVMYEAVLAATAAAIGQIRPGVRGREVDQAARELLSARGFGEQFKHSTGHGVGFAAIDPHARPRLHPQSDDVLQAGMVFNVEPAIYFDGYGGMRHCNVVAVTEDGAEVLTPFQSRIEQLALASTG